MLLSRGCVDGRGRATTRPLTDCRLESSDHRPDWRLLAEMSGGNTYRGRLYADHQSEAMEAANIDDRQKALGVVGTDSVATDDLNRVKKFRDFSADLGGYAIRDRLWWYAAYRRQSLEQGNPVLLDGLHRMSLTVFTTKVSANLTQNQWR